MQSTRLPSSPVTSHPAPRTRVNDAGLSWSAVIVLAIACAAFRRKIGHASSETRT